MTILEENQSAGHWWIGIESYPPSGRRNLGDHALCSRPPAKCISYLFLFKPPEVNLLKLFCSPPDFFFCSHHSTLSEASFFFYFQNNWGIVLLHSLFVLISHGKKPILRALPLVSSQFGFRRIGQWYEYIIHCPSWPNSSLRTDEFEVVVLNPSVLQLYPSPLGFLIPILQESNWTSRTKQRQIFHSGQNYYPPIYL